MAEMIANLVALAGGLVLAVLVLLNGALLVAQWLRRDDLATHISGFANRFFWVFKLGASGDTVHHRRSANG